MALILKQPGIQPLGQFDGLDSVATSVLGGEVGAISSVAVASDLAAADSNDAEDGYVPGGVNRPVVTVNHQTPLAEVLGLVDDGIANYGTIFGSVVGGVAGQQTTGAVLGPHTATGSGKLTLWTKPGTYAVTLDAVDDTLNSGLVPSNAALVVGSPLFAQVTGGLLTPDNTGVVQDQNSNDAVVARFINFETNGSLVTTPVSLASAANSPVGLPTAGQEEAFTQAVIEFNPPLA